MVSARTSDLRCAPPRIPRHPRHPFSHPPLSTELWRIRHLPLTVSMWCLIKLDLDLTTVADAMSSITRNCPRCKVPRRASKTLTIARLPPVLLIQLKRFTTQNGVFWDKSETPVIFPVNGLDMSRYVPRRQPTGKEDLDDPRTQVAPFKYDLYGVSNHMGTLSSGHCE